MTPKIHCLYDELIDAEKLTPHERNRNKHPDNQIKRLAEIIDYQGWRSPVTISKLSHQITTGHGRVQAAILKKWPVPVVYQDYDSVDSEYAHVQSDNAIASWAELDFSGINSDIEILGPDFNIEMLGLKDFKLDASEKKKEPFKCPECGWVKTPC